MRGVLRTIPGTVARHEATFQRARREERALEPYEAGGDMLAALAKDSPVPMPERQTIVSTLLRLHQATHHPLWQALLLEAFTPVLLGLRASAPPRDGDRDQRLLLAFFQALDRVPATAQLIFLAVRHATVRALFGTRRKQPEEIETVPLESFRSKPGRSAHVDAEPFVACLAREVVEHLGRHTGGEDAARVLAGIETPSELATRVDASESGNTRLEATGSRLRQRQRRAVHEVRATLEREGRSLSVSRLTAKRVTSTH